MSAKQRMCLLFGSLVALAVTHGAVWAADDDEADYEIHEISLWGLDPTLEQANQLQHYPSSMPGMVDTERSRTGQPGRLAPFALLTFHGQEVEDLELDLRVQNGRFLGHWLPGESKSGRIRWIELATSAEPAEKAKPSNVDAKHWFNQARQLDGLHVSHGTRSERFLIYDCELKYASAVKLTGGSGTYQVTNLTTQPLSELYLVVPDGEKRRIGHLATLAASKPQPPASPQPAAPGQPPAAQPGSSAAPRAPAAGAAPAPPPPPKPVAEVKQAEAKKPEEKKAEEAQKKADEEQKKVEEAQKKADAKKAGDQPADAKPADAKPADSKPADEKKPEPAAAAKPAEEPGTDVPMSPPLADDSAELESIKASFAEGLRTSGLTAKEVELFMSTAAKSIFDSNEMLVVYRLPPALIEERLPLVAYPAPRKTVRVAWMVVRNIDPRIKDEVEKLVAELGADDYAQRERAEKRLGELGRLAVPALKRVLTSADPEVAYRAERILLGQNEKIDGS